MKKSLISLALAFILFSANSCGISQDSNENTPVSSADFSFTDVKLGEDYTDISAKLTVLTNRTDLIQDRADSMEFPDYAREFQKLYPNITINFEGVSDYDNEVYGRLQSGSWGDICCIPTVAGGELEQYFDPLCEYGDIKETYNFASSMVSSGTVYGIPFSGTIHGILYNKKVWADAGITEIPRTPDEFLNDLQIIKDNTDAVPLYTNYASGWALVTWDANIFGAGCGRNDYRYTIIPNETEPFSKRADGAGAYGIYDVLYQAVSRGLIEDDPNSTSWELCKEQINNGEIAAMLLGSWAVPQMQAAGNNPDDISYMPFPLSIDGVQYTTIAGDYSYGVNKKISDEKKIASKLFIKFMIENSSYASDQESLPVVKTQKYPKLLADFEDVVMLEEAYDTAVDPNLYTKINTSSGINLESDPEHIIRIIDAAINGSETLDEITADMNEAWKSAADSVQETAG